MSLCRSLIRPSAARLSTAHDPAAAAVAQSPLPPTRRLKATKSEDLAEFRRICECLSAVSLPSQVSLPSADNEPPFTAGEFGRATRDDFPLATDIQLRVPIYDSKSILSSPLPAALSELHSALEGPGVFVLRGAVPDAAVIRNTSTAFEEIIAKEKKGRTGFADHFAASGANDRIWNSFQKAAESSPKDFLDYYSSPAM